MLLFAMNLNMYTADDENMWWSGKYQWMKGRNY